MKIKDGTRIVFLAILVLVGCISSSIVFAAVTSRLKIDGYAYIANAKWSVKFINLEDAILSGSTEEIRKPTIQSNSTSIGSFDVKFKEPNDSITYYFEIINDGDLNAKLSSITMPIPSCIGSGDNKANDELLVCANLKYQLTYADGSSINVDDELARGTKKKIKLFMQYVGTELPQEVVNIKDLGISIIYGQK